MLETRMFPGAIVRRRQCVCGARWTSDERPRRGTLLIVRPNSPPLPAGVNQQELITTGRGQDGEKDPYGQGSINGGVGGDLFSPGSGSSLSGISPDSSKSNQIVTHFDERPAKRRRRRVSYSADFLAFWALYPAYRRVKKPFAAVAWENEQPDIEAVKRALTWQIPDWAKSERKYTPHPASYINARRWEDEQPPPEQRSNGYQYRQLDTPVVRNFREEATQQAFDGYRAQMAKLKGGPT